MTIVMPIVMLVQTNVISAMLLPMTMILMVVMVLWGVVGWGGWGGDAGDAGSLNKMVPGGQEVVRSTD